MGQYLLVHVGEVIFLIFDMVINFHDFSVVDRDTHDRLPRIWVLSFFLKILIKIIYGHNLFTDVFRLLEVGENFTVLQFFVRVICLELSHSNHLLSGDLVVLLVLELLENSQVTLFLDVRIGDSIEKIRGEAIQVGW